jgi:hypothetical protein
MIDVPILGYWRKKEDEQREDGVLFAKSYTNPEKISEDKSIQLIIPRIWKTPKPPDKISTGNYVELSRSTNDYIEVDENEYINIEENNIIFYILFNSICDNKLCKSNEYDEQHVITKAHNILNDNYVKLDKDNIYLYIPFLLLFFWYSTIIRDAIVTDVTFFRYISIADVPLDKTQRGTYYGTLYGYKSDNEYLRFDSVKYDPERSKNSDVQFRRDHFRRSSPHHKSKKKKSDNDNSKSEGDRHRKVREELHKKFTVKIDKKELVMMSNLCDKTKNLRGDNYHDVNLLKDVAEVETNYRIMTEKGEMIVDLAFLSFDKKVVEILEIKDTHDDDDEKKEKIASFGKDEIMLNIEDDKTFNSAMLNNLFEQRDKPLEEILKKLNFAYHAYNPKTLDEINKRDREHADDIKRLKAEKKKRDDQRRAEFEEECDEDEKSRIEKEKLITASAIEKRKRDEDYKRIAQLVMCESKKITLPEVIYEQEIKDDINESILNTDNFVQCTDESVRHSIPFFEDKPLRAGYHKETFRDFVTGVELITEYGRLKLLIKCDVEEHLGISLGKHFNNLQYGELNDYDILKRSSTQIGIFAQSLRNLGRNIYFNLKDNYVLITPTIIGKLCTFEYEDGTFISNQGRSTGKKIIFDKWRLTKVADSYTEDGITLPSLENNSATVKSIYNNINDVPVITTEVAQYVFSDVKADWNSVDVTTIKTGESLFVGLDDALDNINKKCSEDKQKIEKKRRDTNTCIYSIRTFVDKTKKQGDINLYQYIPDIVVHAARYLGWLSDDDYYAYVFCDVNYERKNGLNVFERANRYNVNKKIFDNFKQ